MPSSLVQFLSEHREELIAGLLVSSALLFLILLALIVRVGRLNRLYMRLTRNTSGGNLEDILHEYMATVTNDSARMDRVEKALSELQENQRHCLQRSGMVRFDAFDDVGGEQSFAVVLLDATKTGMAISSVYSRSDARVYAKAIRDGKPSHPLTREEERAMAECTGSARP